MKKFAIFAYVRETKLNDFSNTATWGTPIVARELKTALRSVFHNNIADLGPFTTKGDIIYALTFAARNLLPRDSLCFFYFHGHGASLPNRYFPDEEFDQVLVCHDDYLYDDTLSEVIQQFKPSQRIFSIVDSCSSASVIEWPKITQAPYPQIIHLASALDDGNAYALANGGIFSRRILNLIYGYNYTNFTYQSFARKLRSMAITTQFNTNITSNLNHTVLNSKIFT